MKQIMSFFVLILVVVIDFGIIFFGYVFFFCYEFDKDFEKISIINWVVGGQVLVFLKIFFVVLLKLDRIFYLFGFEVENKYGDLVGDGEYVGWLYFK